MKGPMFKEMVIAFDSFLNYKWSHKCLFHLKKEFAGQFLMKFSISYVIPLIKNILKSFICDVCCNENFGFSSSQNPNLFEKNKQIIILKNHLVKIWF